MAKHTWTLQIRARTTRYEGGHTPGWTLSLHEPMDEPAPPRSLLGRLLGFLTLPERPLLIERLPNAFPELRLPPSVRPSGPTCRLIAGPSKSRLR